MFCITKEFHFSASHQLRQLPADHQCARLHGHNYIVVVELAAAELNAFGFVRDYHDLAPLKRCRTKSAYPRFSGRPFRAKAH